MKAYQLTYKKMGAHSFLRTFKNVPLIATKVIHLEKFSEKSPLNLGRDSALRVGYILKMNLKALREAVSLAPIHLC